MLAILIYLHLFLSANSYPTIFTEFLSYQIEKKAIKSKSSVWRNTELIYSWEVLINKINN